MDSFSRSALSTMVVAALSSVGCNRHHHLINQDWPCDNADHFFTILFPDSTLKTDFETAEKGLFDPEMTTMGFEEVQGRLSSKFSFGIFAFTHSGILQEGPPLPRTSSGLMSGKIATTGISCQPIAGHPVPFCVNKLSPDDKQRIDISHGSIFFKDPESVATQTHYFVPCHYMLHGDGKVPSIGTYDAATKADKGSVVMLEGTHQRVGNKWQFNVTIVP
jgi:hypothetical protein